MIPCARIHSPNNKENISLTYNSSNIVRWISRHKPVWICPYPIHENTMPYTTNCLTEKEQIPLTVCPLSNIKLRIFDNMRQHNFKQMLDLGLCVTINSDDPAYFGGYIEDNFKTLQAVHNLSFQDIYKIVRNSFTASFLTRAEKQTYLNELDGFVSDFAQSHLKPSNLVV